MTIVNSREAFPLSVFVISWEGQHENAAHIQDTLAEYIIEQLNK